MQLKLLLFFLTTLLVTSNKLQAQLCTGSLGDPVVNITFGSGANPGPAQPTTTYQYLTSDCPQDGQYSMRNSTVGCFGNTWHTLNSDHTGDPNGYFMLVNASYAPGDFYVQTVTGLCGNTTYEFAAWVVNVQHPVSCNGRAIKPNLTFSIETASGTKLGTFNSGDIELTSQPEWKQYGTFFTTPANVSSVVIRLTNNAPGGCGNDIGLDDITFRPCGANVVASIEGSGATQMQVCAGNNATRKFISTIPDGYQNPELQWQESRDGGQTWASIAGATTNSYQWNETVAGTFYYRALVAEKGNINAPSCRVASKPIMVTVSAPPEIVLPTIAATCEGSAINFDVAARLKDTVGLRFDWSGASLPGFTRTETGEQGQRIYRIAKPVATIQDSGWYDVTLTSGAGCTATSRFLLPVLRKPIIDFGVTGPACADQAVKLASNVVNNLVIDQYKWKWDNGNVANSQEISPVLGGAGEYAVELSVVGSNGCQSDVVEKKIQIQASPVPFFTMPDVCLADAFAQFTDQSVVAGGEPLTYRWQFGDAANPAATSADKNPRYRYGAVGNYEVSLSVTSAAGCTADTAQVFTVNGSKPNALFSLNDATVRCSADTVVLRNTSSVDFGNITRVEIFWKGDGDQQANTLDDAPAPGKEYKFNYTPFVRVGTNTFTIRMVAYSGESCMDELEQQITIQRSPVIQFDAIASLCQGAPPVLLASARETTGAEGQGAYSGTGVNGQGIFNPLLPGEQQITYRFTTPEGCTDTAIQTAQVWPLPLVQAGPDKTVVAGGSVALAAQAEGQGLQLQWSPATGLSDAAILQPLAAPQTDISYTLTATSAQGCIASDEVKVFTIAELFIPNAFTPNGDGINDTWQVPYLESMPDAEVRVFNRYGQQVYMAKGAARGWDGRIGGKDQPTGAFVYLVKISGGKILRGTLMLIR